MAVQTTNTTPKTMIKVQEPPKLATPSAMRSPKVYFSSITSLALRLARSRTSCCDAWNWWPSTVSISMPAIGLRCSRIAMSSRLISTQVVFFHGDGVCLVGRLVQHGGEAEKLAMAGLVDHNFLVVFVDRGHLNAAGQQDVCVHARIADLVDALAGQRTSSGRPGRPGPLFHHRQAGQRAGRV